MKRKSLVRISWNFLRDFEDSSWKMPPRKITMYVRIRKYELEQWYG